MKKLSKFLIIALCFLLPLYTSINLQAATPPTPVEKPAPTQPEIKPDTDKNVEVNTAEFKRQKTLIEADKLYLDGKQKEAEKLYQEVKLPFKDLPKQIEKKPAVTDITKISPAAKVYWRIANEGLEQKLETKILAPLQLLVEKFPEFVPGQIAYAQALKDYKRLDEGLAILEKATNLYSDNADLLRAKIAFLADKKQWLEASLSARQFALIYPNDPAANEFITLADKNMKAYQDHLRREIRGNLIGNILTGALGYALTGSLYGPFSAVQSAQLLLQGESSLGKDVAEVVKKRTVLIDDPKITKYVTDLGQKLAKFGGRKEFEYEFNVIYDERLNAFALPGGKVFINSGAIMKTNSEAELAGLLGHEISHAVLSHGFQLVTQGNLISNLTQFIPYIGGLVENIAVLSYSRDMEKQADIVGTRILSASGFAADGMRNLMVTLGKEYKDRPSVNWLSSHPISEERVKYLENLIVSNGYNRYAYEGVNSHQDVQTQFKELMPDLKKKQEKLKQMYGY